MIINRLIFFIGTKQLNNLGYVYQLIRAFSGDYKQNNTKLCNTGNECRKMHNQIMEGLASKFHIRVVIICYENNTAYVCDKFLLLINKDKLLIKL